MRRSLASLSMVVPLFAVAFGSMRAEERPVDPTFLYRFLPQVSPQSEGICRDRCRYFPVFGAGDAQADELKGIARFGVLEIEPGGASLTTELPDEEQVCFVLEGSGTLHYADSRVTLKQEDFVYLPPGVAHGISASDTQRIRVVVMGYRIPPGLNVRKPDTLKMASASQAVAQTVAGHPASTRYRLLMGDVTSTRDLLATGNVVTSLFVMEFDPGGTNQPHHHLVEEEIYLLLEGTGEIVAGGGMDGVEGRHPAQAGDAYFFRPNCTVGFYADPDQTGGAARILAVRSRYPGLRLGDIP